MQVKDRSHTIRTPPGSSSASESNRELFLCLEHLARLQRLHPHSRSHLACSASLLLLLTWARQSGRFVSFSGTRRFLRFAWDRDFYSTFATSTRSLSAARRLHDERSNKIACSVLVARLKGCVRRVADADRRARRAGIAAREVRRSTLVRKVKARCCLKRNPWIQFAPRTRSASCCCTSKNKFPVACMTEKRALFRALSSEKKTVEQIQARTRNTRALCRAHSERERVTRY